MNTKIISLQERRNGETPSVPLVSTGEQIMHLDTNICPTCKMPIRDDLHGWVRTAELSEKTGYKAVIAPCPTCSGDVQTKREARRKAAELSRLFGGANIPFQYKDWTFSTFPKDSEKRPALEQVKDWLAAMLGGDDTSKRGLYLQGEFGVGKTSLAISALKEILQAGQPGLFLTTTTLLLRIRACYNKDAPFAEDEVLRALTETPYVVLDDLGAEKPSEDAIKQLYYIFDTRLSKGLYTIITSNRPATIGAICLEKYWDAKSGNLNARRAIERILQHCQGITVHGQNIRTK
jgi:DNA replication protein DnaC